MGALITVALAALARMLLTGLFESRGHWLDPWRRVWFHPEREGSLFLEVLLIASFLTTFADLYALPVWVASVLFVAWALHLPTDVLSWIRLRRRPQGTLELHRRGFLLVGLGPLWVRVLVAGLAAGLYLLPTPLRSILNAVMALVACTLQAWLT